MPGIVLAVDLGGTKIEAALLEPGGVIRADTRFRAPTGLYLTLPQLTAAVVEVVSEAMAAIRPDDVLLGSGSAPQVPSIVVPAPHLR